jgi:hypothetical protein
LVTLAIQDVKQGETFNCMLGADTVMHVSYTRKVQTERPKTQPLFAPAMQTTTHTRIVTVHNRHAFDLEDVVIREQVPCTGDLRVKVELIEPVGLAEGECPGARWCGTKGEKEGRFEWYKKLKKEEILRLKAVWEVKSPLDVLVTEMTGF